MTKCTQVPEAWILASPTTIIDNYFFALISLKAHFFKETEKTKLLQPVRRADRKGDRETLKSPAFESLWLLHVTSN